jgi:hypothetical protein
MQLYKISYGPTSILIGLPPQSYQYLEVHQQFPFLATLYLPDFSQLMNDPISHSSFCRIILSKLPSDISKFDGKPEDDPNIHVMNFHIWCSSNSFMDDSIFLYPFQ